MNNLVSIFLTFQSPEFWNEIGKCVVEEERDQAIKQIRTNAKISLEKFVFSLIIACLIAFSLKQIL